MSEFINDNFILHNETAVKLYHEHAAKMPIIDYHNHLNPQEIFEDRVYDNLTEVWLGGGHYKWRAMRANGVPEELVTGSGDAYKKYQAYADTVQKAFGNPLYHWTHLELKRYFGIDENLNPDTAEEIWDKCNERLRSSGFSALNLLRMQNVKVLCTTDNPADDLEWHRKIRETVDDIRVLPSFRPGDALDIEKEGFGAYMARLGDAAGLDISSFEDLVEALRRRLIFFMENGCRVTDHSLECDFFVADDPAEADRIFKKRLGGEAVTEQEAAMYRGVLMKKLGGLYADNSLAMQLHIGALRNNSDRMFEKIGADTGYDSLNDFNYEGIRSKIQLGSAWWFMDHMNGMKLQLETLCDGGLLSGFIGMLTDSRSFLSFPRHEYFRRILCNLIGEKVERGEYPADMEYLGRMVEDICYNNAKTYFGL